MSYNRSNISRRFNSAGERMGITWISHWPNSGPSSTFDLNTRTSFLDLFCTVNSSQDVTVYNTLFVYYITWPGNRLGGVIKRWLVYKQFNMTFSCHARSVSHSGLTTLAWRDWCVQSCSYRELRLTGSRKDFARFRKSCSRAPPFQDPYHLTKIFSNSCRCYKCSEIVINR